MGLHLCYELSLPPETGEGVAWDLLDRLRVEACRLPVATVSPMFALSGDESTSGTSGQGDPLRWVFAVQASGPAVASTDPNYPRSVRADRALGFVVWPGARSEAAAFGLARYPEPVVAHRGDAAYPTRGWHWHAVCKTQYASLVSDQHLLECHLALVDLLDTALRLGFEVTVRDETHYWETRDPERLLAEVHEMNRVVARIAGRIGDALPDGVEVGGAIVEHPRFEPRGHLP